MVTVEQHDRYWKDAHPFRQQLRRQPISVTDVIDKQVQQMLETGVIEPSTSPWVSNVVMVKKKDGTMRFCVDYRQLNKLTRKDAYPLPRIDSCLDAMAGSRFFSTFDLRSGYHQLRVCEADSDKTSFATRTGTYRFRRLPFGLCNSGSTFQRVMDIAMRGLNFTLCLVYLDDIIVYSPTVEEHMSRLEALFDRLRQAGLKLKPSKCELVRTTVDFLGHRVSGDGVSTAPSKIEAVVAWPVPCNVTEVRAFLGLCGYYRRFVCNFANIAAPLHALTGHNQTFRWTVQCQEAFDSLKAALSSSPVLVMPDDTGRFILDTDASGSSLGAVLSQVQEGRERVVAFGSRVLSKTEKNYCVTRRELLAVVTFVRFFKQYLLGRNFLIRTDHSCLRWLRHTPEPIGQQARWCSILEEFDFEIEHRPGKSHGNADALSRRPCRQCGAGEDRVPGQVRAVKPVPLIPVVQGLDQEQMAKDYETDPQLAEFYNLKSTCEECPAITDRSGFSGVTKTLCMEWDRFKIEDGVLFRKWWVFGKGSDRWQLIPPSFCREKILDVVHAGFGGGHLGVRKMRARLQQQCFWPGWQRDVESFCSRCPACASYFRGTPPRRGKLQLAPVGEPWERLAIDITGPHPVSATGFRFLLTGIDLFTKWAFAIPCRNHEAQTVARLLVEQVFTIFGPPAQLLSDRGPEFESNLMKELCIGFGIDKIRTTAYKPSTNGAVERFHRTLNSMLGKVISRSQRDWDLHVPYVLSAYRSSVHEATGFSPNYLMFGRELRVPIELVVGFPVEETGQEFNEVVSQRLDRFRDAYKLAREHLGQTAQRMKRTYDLRVREKDYKPGDRVWLFSPRKFVGLSSKWGRGYTGPYEVTEKLSQVNYAIRKSPRGNIFVCHIDKLKPYLTPGIEPVSIPGEINIGDNEIRPGGQKAPRQGAKTDIEPDTKPGKHFLRPQSSIKLPSRYCNRLFLFTDSLSSTAGIMSSKGDPDTDHSRQTICIDALPAKRSKTTTRSTPGARVSTCPFCSHANVNHEDLMKHLKREHKDKHDELQQVDARHRKAKVADWRHQAGRDYIPPEKGSSDKPSHDSDVESDEPDTQAQPDSTNNSFLEDEDDAIEIVGDSLPDTGEMTYSQALADLETPRSSSTPKPADVGDEMAKERAKIPDYMASGRSRPYPSEMQPIRPSADFTTVKTTGNGKGLHKPNFPVTTASAAQIAPSQHPLAISKGTAQQLLLKCNQLKLPATATRPADVDPLEGGSHSSRKAFTSTGQSTQRMSSAPATCRIRSGSPFERQTEAATSLYDPRQQAYSLTHYALAEMGNFKAPYRFDEMGKEVANRLKSRIPAERDDIKSVVNIAGAGAVWMSRQVLMKAKNTEEMKKMLEEVVKSS